MKKMIVILMCAALAVTFTACGSSSSEGEISTTEEAAEETEEVTEEEADIEYVSATYKGMTFSLPGDWYYQGDDSAMSFISPDSEAMILLQSVDLSESEDEYNDEALDILFEASFEAIQAQYSDFREEATTDLTIAGCEAKEMTATVTSGDTQMSDDALVIYDEDGQYFYLIQYVVKSEVEENTSTYEHFLESLSFDVVEEAADESIPSEYQAALNRAESYSERMHMSKQGIYDQLTSEYGDQFDEDAAQYAVDNMVADWNANALETAKSYSDSMHMSKQGIYDQLTSEYGEQFTADEAQYAVDNVDADWNANALEKAKEYRDRMDMSESAIHDQLTSEYGEKFTEEEADYAIANLN